MQASQFTSEQLEAIMKVEEKIPDLTWHHHQDVGRMQLISEKLHQSIGHEGGFNLWYNFFEFKGY